ncbi:hypothetical protein [Capnocytophaga gingivalis]|nr:hypothetical protein [Capnocytophaga gingivalis]
MLILVAISPKILAPAEASRYSPLLSINVVGSYGDGNHFVLIL